MRSPADVWTALLRWYRKRGRELPWRGTDDDYRVTVSEFMLQQTQVDRVLPLFLAFTRRFPDWRALAEAPQAEVVRAWKGLGYNLRALRLRELARQVVERHGGRLPAALPALLAMKGVGPYTARALRVFAHRERALAPDTNVRRVLARVFRGAKADPLAWDEAAWEKLEATVPERAAYDLNQALMDLGASACKARKPDCASCPLMRSCRSYPRILSLAPERLPAQKPPRKERVDAFGVPNRIYRGRVIEALRRGPVARTGLIALGKAVRGRFGRADLPWLETVLSGLERDGLIRARAGAYELA